MTETSWPFRDPQNTAVFTTRSVVQGGKPILHVTHDVEDGAWQFHHGKVYGLGDAMVVSLAEIVELDPTLAELADLPVGGCADRAYLGAKWIRSIS